MEELTIIHPENTNTFNILNVDVPKEKIHFFLKNAYRQSLESGPDFRPFTNLQRDYKIKLQYMETTKNYKIDCNGANWTLVYDLIRRASLEYSLIQDNKANLSTKHYKSGGRDDPKMKEYFKMLDGMGENERFEDGE